MAIDLILTILHHLAVFGLVGMLAAEMALIRSQIDGRTIARLARIDAVFGITAGLAVVGGGLRVAFGAKGWEFFVYNPWFWAKMASFLAAGLLSIGPTLRFAAWRRAAARLPDFRPDAATVAQVRRMLHGEALLVVLILVLAATMVRYG